MTLVAVVGDATTTTCLALAAAWPIDHEVVVLEADPAGGSLAGWLDTPSSPSLATIVANIGTDASRPAAALATIASMTRRSTSGVRFISAPLRAVPARRAILEAATVVIPTLAAAQDVVAITDLGRRHATEVAAAVPTSAETTVVVHRQRSTAAAAAEAVRLERLVELVEQLGRMVCLVVIGRAPFDPHEIAQHVDTSVPGALTHWFALAEDPLAAAVLAGRSGVSAKRLARLPLMRSAAEAARRLAPTAPLRHGVGR